MDSELFANKTLYRAEDSDTSDVCDLDPNKICDNCMACVMHGDYRAIIIDEIIEEAE